MGAFAISSVGGLQVYGRELTVFVVLWLTEQRRVVLFCLQVVPMGIGLGFFFFFFNRRAISALVLLLGQTSRYTEQ